MYWKNGELQRDMIPPELSESEWKEQRTHGLGATAVAAIAGVHKFQTPSDVYAEYTGLAEPLDDNVYMWWGRKAEPLIIERFMLDTDIEVVQTGYRNFVHPEARWARATPDGLCLHEEAGFEAKEAGVSQKYRWGEEWTDDVPEEYLCQCQWSMFVTGAPRWYLAVKIDRRLYKYQIERDEGLIKNLHTRAQWFWTQHILPERIPPVDGSKQYATLIEKIYPESTEEMIAAGAAEIDILDKYETLQSQIDPLQSESEEIKNVFRTRIGDNRGIDFGSRGKVLYYSSGGGDKVDWRAVTAALQERYDIPKKDMDEIQGNFSKTQRRYRVLKMPKGGK